MMRRLVAGGLVALLLTGCATGSPNGSPQASSSDSAAVGYAPPILDASELESIRDARVFFAHRSVGAEIVEQGVPAVYEEFDLPPLAANEDEGARFFDDWLEQTEDPMDKLESFPAILAGDFPDGSVDVAFMKLGYVDIVEETDVEALFEAYTAMMDDLSASYPTVTFLHVTVTPTRWQPENNAKIEEFNELVRQEYADRGRLIDLAGALSQCPDGTVDRHETEEGDSYSQICEAFTRDGGHLSPEGAATAAAELLSVVAANLVDR